MIIGKGDIKRLRWPIAGAVILIAIGIAAVTVSEQYVGIAKEKRKGTLAKRTAAQERLASAATEEKEIRANLVHYQKMLDAGIVGPKDRLDLIEKISAIKASRKLFDIKYNISAQRALEYPGIQATGIWDFVNSPMRLDMALLHEEDLLNFLSDLQASRQTHVVVRQCTLQRISGVVVTPTTSVPTLRSECLVDLINLLEAKPS